jgi:transcriptional regulator with XRE-family HTH domain
MATTSTRSGDTEQVRIGETLRALRLARGVRIGELAKKLDISHAYLSNIEHGRRPLTAQLLPRVADLLAVRPIAIVRPDHFDDADVA